MLYNEITYLFGLPIFKVKIKPELYEKKKILSQIEKNYKTSKVRNKWSLDSYLLTDIHHSIKDDDNPALKKTILFVTHDFDEALRIADRIAIMKDGIIEQIDTPAKIVNDWLDFFCSRSTRYSCSS